MLVLLLLILLWPSNPAPQNKSLDDRLQEAATLIAADRLTEAEQQLTGILKIAPNESRAVNLLGTIRAKEGKLAAAETLFLRAVRLDPKLVGAHMNLAYLYVLRAQPDKTAAQLQQVLQIEPDNADAAYKLASLRLKQGKTDVCIDVVNKFKESNPLTVPLVLVLGDAYLNKRDFDKAEESYRLAETMQSPSAEANLGLTQIALLRGNSTAAVEHLNRSEELIKDSPDLCYQFAVLALNAGLFDRAMAAIKRAIELKADEPSYYFVLGVVWVKNSDPQEAESAFRAFLKARSEDPQGQLYLGYVLLKQKKNPEAEKWIAQSIRNDPARPEAYYYLGLIAQDANEEEKAVNFFETAIKLQPSLTSAHTALGASYLKLKDYARAQQQLETAVKQNPDDSKAHYNLALLYARLKDEPRSRAEMDILQRLKASGKTQEAEIDAVTPGAKPR
jgi:tetratricopeptide (TPR) repeat protein